MTFFLLLTTDERAEMCHLTSKTLKYTRV